MLAGLARASSAVHRVQWVERTVPEDGDAMGRHLSEAVRVPRDHATLKSYVQLVDGASPAASRHEALLVVAISAGRARRAIRQAGGGDDGAARLLLREVVTLQRRLTSDVIVDGILGPRMVAAAIRTAFDPSARQHMARRAAAAQDDGGTAPGNAWPLATETTWRPRRRARCSSGSDARASAVRRMISAGRRPVASARGASSRSATVNDPLRCRSTARSISRWRSGCSTMRTGLPSTAV